MHRTSVVVPVRRREPSPTHGLAVVTAVGGSRRVAYAVTGGLALSAVALAAAPAVLPADYSWAAHTTSESAGQGVAGAWLARSGFVLLGVSVLALARTTGPRWGLSASGLHATFGGLMIAAAVFSSRPWDTTAPFDRVEDVLHSVAATGMGFAFALGVAAVAWRRHGAGVRPHWRDGVAVLAAVALPLAMTWWPGSAGALQRAMFLVAYAWYGLEAVATTHPAGRTGSGPSPVTGGGPALGAADPVPGPATRR
jgi:hypothetical protein